MGSGQKRQRADWPPSLPGEEFSYTFTGQETLRLSANDIIKVCMCAEGQHGNVAQAIKHNHPHGDNAHNFLKSAAKYCLAHPLIATAGMQTFFKSAARPPTGVCAFVRNFCTGYGSTFEISKLHRVNAADSTARMHSHKTPTQYRNAVRVHIACPRYSARNPRSYHGPCSITYCHAQSSLAKYTFRQENGS